MRLTCAPDFDYSRVQEAPPLRRATQRARRRAQQARLPQLGAVQPRRAPNLHKLFCAVKEKEIPHLGGALSGCENLKVLVDVGAGESGGSGMHGSAPTPGSGHHPTRRAGLTTEPVKTLMHDVPSLKKVVCENRVWTVSYTWLSDR